MNNTIFNILFSGIVAVCFYHPVLCQDKKWYAFREKEESTNKKKDPLIQINIRQSGPYFGIQQGRYTVGELGGEMQWRQIRLKKPITHSATLGLDYNITQNVLGFNAGYYYKGGRTKFTFGGNIVYKTDFSYNRFGIGPAIGYKLFAFHGQVGYHLLTPHEQFINTNTIFVSLRFTLINDRDLEVKTRWSKKK